MSIKKLSTIDADTLQSIPYAPLPFVVEDLLPQGLHLLAGAPKIGKSWLALWLCLCAAQGKPLWNFATKPCEALYLCLEDSFQRIQSRLFDLTEDAPPSLHFAVMAEQLHSGLVEQIEQFLQEHPATGLVVIDTLQRIRAVGSEANPYASDYRDIGVLKALADRHRIAVLLIHHLLDGTQEPRQRAYLINHFLEQFRTTLYRQTMFAEFELWCSEQVRQGKALTADGLCAKYAELNRLYYGDDIVADPEIALEWARIPHFYYNFYVYQYATGFASAVALSQRILREGQPAVDDYLHFLSGGCSADPVTLLQGAGVDLSTPAPIDDALRYFDTLLGEMEALMSA